MNRRWQDFRYALRQLRMSPVYTAAVIITLALGIGATTAIFTVVYAALLADLPYPKSDQVVVVWSQNGGRNSNVSMADLIDWQKQNHVFQILHSIAPDTMVTVVTTDGPDMVRLQKCTPGTYAMLGLHFQLGRDFRPEESQPGKDQVTILTNRIWKQFGGDPHIVGKQVRIDEKSYTVVGVLAPGITDRWNMKLAAPLSFTPEQLLRRNMRSLIPIGRLKPGVSIVQANADMNVVAANIAAANPGTNKGWGVYVELLRANTVKAPARLKLWLLVGAVGFVLLIACVNVANLLLAKGSTRRKEISIRSAIGAGRHDVFFQFITESLTLACAGGIVGVGLGYALLKRLVADLPETMLPPDADIRLNLPVLLITLAATTIVGLLSGCVPAWYASRVDSNEALKEGGRSGTGRFSRRLLQSLVVGELALALALLAAAGLSMRSFWNLTHVDLGVQTERVLTFRLPALRGMNLSPDWITSHYNAILSSIKAAPGVESAAMMTGMPLQGVGGRLFSVAGQADSADPSQRLRAGFQVVTPDYYKALGIRVVRGRTFTDRDTAASPRVAMINEKLANHFFAGKDPIGQQLLMPEMSFTSPVPGPPQAWEIVGVFHDVRPPASTQQGAPIAQYEEIDVPFNQLPVPTAGFAVRTAGDPAAMTKTIAAAVHAVDPNVPLVNLKTLEQIRGEALASDRLTFSLYVAFAVIALALAAVGIYGVVSFAVGQRTHDIGIRLALGASHGRIVRSILGEGAMMAATGIALGAGGALLLGHAMRSALYNVSGFDLPAFIGVSVLLAVTALVACYIPARRAAGIEPVEALRVE